MRKVIKHMDKIGLASFLILSGTLLALDAGAQGGALPSGTPITLFEIQNIIDRLAGFLLWISAAVMIIGIIWAGITYITAGSNDEKVKLARKRLWTSIIGALIILGLGVIFATLDAIVRRSGSGIGPFYRPGFFD